MKNNRDNDYGIVFRRAPVAMLVVDEQTRVCSLNEAAIRISPNLPAPHAKLGFGNVLDCAYARDDPKGCGFGAHCRTCGIRKAVSNTFRHRRGHANVEAHIVHQSDGQSLEKIYSLSTALLELPDKNRVLVSLQDVTRQKHAEQSLKESEQRYRSVSELISEYAYAYRVADDGTLENEWVAGAFTRYTGYAPEELRAKGGWEALILPEDMGRCLSQLKSLLSDRADTVEYRIVTKEGKVRWVRDAARPVWSRSRQRVVRIEGAVQDITETKQSQRHLLESRTHFQTLFEEAPDAIFIESMDDRILEANRAACEMLGYGRDELLTMHVPDLQAPEVRGKKGEVIKNELAQGDFFVGRNIRKDGSTFPVEVHTRRFGYGEQQCALSIVRDITARRRTEEALRESHQTLLTVLNSIDATIYVADLTTYEILFMNKHMIDTFGRDLTGELCHKAFRAQARPCEECNNRLLIDPDGHPTETVVWQGKNPITGKDYVNYDRAIAWVDGRWVKLQIAFDVSHTKKMAEQLQQAQKMKAIGTLAGGIAHDFNNLLMSIQGNASLMSFDLEPNHPCSEHLSAIMQATKSAADLTKQLLGIARSGKYDVQPFDINAVVRSSAKLFGRTKREIQIHMNLHQRPAVVAADQRQIEQALLNLYINAWQAMPRGGELYLETALVNLDDEFCKPHDAVPGRYAMISVTDTGVGMEKSIQARIFDPFFTTKEKTRGTGLGLSSVYGIVTNHNGIITVDSQVGKGTTFSIYLPVTEKAVRRRKIEADGVVRGSGTILLVDDEPMVLGVGKRMLEKLGYDILLAKDGLEAIDIVSRKADDVDLVILDMIMPGVGGAETFDRIRETNPALPVILSSGYSIDGQATEIMNKGCEGFIQKPFTISELSQKIQAVRNLERD